jgi:hypothetical protein
MKESALLFETRFGKINLVQIKWFVAHWKDFEKGYNKLNFYSLTKENLLNLCPFEKFEHNLPKSVIINQTSIWKVKWHPIKELNMTFEISQLDIQQFVLAYSIW